MGPRRFLSIAIFCIWASACSTQGQRNLAEEDDSRIVASQQTNNNARRASVQNKHTQHGAIQSSQNDGSQSAAEMQLSDVAGAAPTITGCKMPDMRPPKDERRYKSVSVDTYISKYEPLFLNPRLGKLFSNAFPNTLDTTVMHCCAEAEARPDGAKKPDAFIVTGDIDALWLRDSVNQIAPYLRFVNHDKSLRALAVGVFLFVCVCVCVCV
jgi:hypothetical protein